MILSPRQPGWRLLLLAAVVLAVGHQANAAEEPDVLVYGSMPGGVCAAIAAAREGASVLLLEPTWMILGQSAGIAAALAASDGVTVQKLPYPELRGRLLAQGQVLDLPEIKATTN